MVELCKHNGSSVYIRNKKQAILIQVVRSCNRSLMQELGGTRSIRGLQVGDADVIFLGPCAGDKGVHALWKLNKLVSSGYMHLQNVYFKYTYIFKQEWFPQRNDFTLELSSDFTHLHLLHGSILAEGGKIQVYLNKWHLQIFNSKNSLMLPGWLAEWEHMILN